MAESSVSQIDFYHLLEELESGTSGSCANVIRKLREHEVAAYQAGVGGPTGGLIADFLALIDVRMGEKDLEIEKTCSHNYQSFVDSVNELISVQEKAEKLQQNLLDIRGNVINSIQNLYDSCEGLSITHTTLEKIDQCIAALQSSLPVLDQYERVEKSIAEGRYYHALKTLEHLEHYQLKSIQSFAFSECLLKRIPELRAEIKAASLAQLTDFLEEIRKHSTRLGAVTMHQIAEKLGMKDESIVNSFEDNSLTHSSIEESNSMGEISGVDATSQAFQIKEKGSKTTKGSVLEAELEELAAASVLSDVVTNGTNESAVGGTANNPSFARSQVKNNIEEVINFSPVYRCLHIHSVSGERAEFEHYYFTQRKKQCQLILSLSPTQQANLRNYGEFFSTIVGFFLVDDYLRHTLPGATFSYQAYLNELWALLVPRLIQLANTNAEACRTSSELLNLKHYCVLFDHTMTSLEFHTAGLGQMLDAIRKRYNSLLILQYRAKFEDILANDNYTAITLNGPEDLIPLLDNYPYCRTAEFNEQPYPRLLVFSMAVPRIYATLRDYIDACFVFIKSMDLAWTELEDALNRAANSLFTDCLNEIVNRVINDSRLNLLRLIQLTINLNELESACEHLQAYLHENARPRFFSEQVSRDLHEVDLNEEDLRISQPEDMSLVQPSRSHLYGVSLFKDARALAETQIYANLNTRIEEFCNLAVYNGIFGGPGEGTIEFDELCNVGSIGRITFTASGYMKDMTAWLGSTFAAFTNLPPKVAQTAVISASKHIVRILQNILMGPEVKMVTEPALTLLSIDLSECDNFARSDPVPGIDKSILPLIFQELKQLLDLVRKDDWKVYFDNYSKAIGNPYDRVTPSAAINLLERIREAEKRRSSFLGAIKKGERERRRHLEDIIKQLRDVQNAAFRR